MREIKLLLLDHPDKELSEGTSVTFLTDDFTSQHEKEIFFHNLRDIVRPDVRIFEANASMTAHFIRGKFQEVGKDPKR